MNNYEYISYEPTPYDALQIGIVTLLYNSEIILRFKHMKKKDNSGVYFVSPSISVTNIQQEKKYQDGIEIDSTRKREELMKFLRQCAADALKRTKIPEINPSVFVNTMSNTAIQMQQQEQELPF